MFPRKKEYLFLFKFRGPSEKHLSDKDTLDRYYYIVIIIIIIIIIIHSSGYLCCLLINQLMDLRRSVDVRITHRSSLEEPTPQVKNSILVIFFFTV